MNAVATLDAMPLSAEDILRAVGTPRRLVADSRRVEPGDAFAACPGERTDGRRYIGQAIDRGAAGVLWEPASFDWAQGWRVANVALVRERPLPPELDKVDPRKIVGLVCEPSRLTDIRRARLRTLGQEDTDYGDIEAIEEEIRNRFGPPPPPVDRLVALARLREQCRAQAVARINAGPQAIALSFTGEADRSSAERAVARSDGALAWRKDRLVWSKTSGSPEERLEQASKLLRFLAKAERPR